MDEVELLEVDHRLNLHLLIHFADQYSLRPVVYLMMEEWMNFLLLMLIVVVVEVEVWRVLEVLCFG